MNQERSKKDSEIFCPECGQPISRQAVVCIHCGVQVKDLKTSVKRESTGTENASKTKSTAILLSVFFGHWSWLYTYKKNYKKFWIGFGIIFILNFITFTLILIFSVEEVFINYGTLVWFVWLVANISMWVWALADNISKPDIFYTGYPNG